MEIITCPICKHQIVAIVSRKIVSDIDEKIKEHAKNHTVKQILDFVELDLARQANDLEKKQKVKA